MQRAVSMVGELGNRIDSQVFVESRGNPTTGSSTADAGDKRRRGCATFSTTFADLLKSSRGREFVSQVSTRRTNRASPFPGVEHSFNVIL